MENTTGANMIHCRELSDNQQLSNKHRDRYTDNDCKVKILRTCINILESGFFLGIDIISIFQCIL